MRRHFVTQHGVGIRISRSGHIEEFELSDVEYEARRIRRRQAKTPYLKERHPEQAADVTRSVEGEIRPLPTETVPSLLSLTIHSPPIRSSTHSLHTAVGSTLKPFITSETAVGPALSSDHIGAARDYCRQFILLRSPFL